jgi:SulP family sulfate permease
MIGIGLSLVWLISVATRPNMPLLAREADTQVFREIDENPDDELIPGVVVLRMDGGLFFATSDALEDRMRQLIHETPALTGIVLDCGGINFVDSQGAAKFGDVVDLAEDSGITLRLARLKPLVRATLDRDGIVDRLGEDHVHGNVFRAVQAQLAATHTPTDGPLV